LSGLALNFASTLKVENSAGITKLSENKQPASHARAGTDGNDSVGLVTYSHLKFDFYKIV